MEEAKITCPSCGMGELKWTTGSELNPIKCSMHPYFGYNNILCCYAEFRNWADALEFVVKEMDGPTFRFVKPRGGRFAWHIRQKTCPHYFHTWLWCEGNWSFTVRQPRRSGFVTRLFWHEMASSNNTLLAQEKPSNENITLKVLRLGKIKVNGFVYIFTYYFATTTNVFEFVSSNRRVLSSKVKTWMLFYIINSFFRLLLR